MPMNLPQLDPPVIAGIFMFVGVILLLAAFSRREQRKVDAQLVKLGKGTDAPGIDEDFAEQLAPIDGTAGADTARDNGA